MVNSFNSRTTLRVGDLDYTIYRLDAVAKAHPNAARLPYSLKILLENLLRTEDGQAVRADDVEALANWDPKAEPDKEIAFTPARVLLQDFTGVPGRRGPGRHARRHEAHGRRPEEDQPAAAGRAGHRPFGAGGRLRQRPRLPHTTPTCEFERNRERYAFLRWGQKAFRNFNVVPPDTGIVHQVNLEYLARVVFTDDDGRARDPLAYPGHAGRHRLAHDDDQRPGRARLGRRRHRGRGGHARPAGVDAHPAGGRLPAQRPAAAKAPPPPTSC